MPRDIPETEVAKLRKIEATNADSADTVTGTWLMNMVSDRKVNEIKITPIGNDYETGLLDKITRLPNVMSITTRHGQASHRVRPIIIGCSGWMNLSILLHSLPSLDTPTPVLFITDINPNVIKFWQQMVKAAQETEGFHRFIDRFHELLITERLDEQIDAYDKDKFKGLFRELVLHQQRGLSPKDATIPIEALFEVIQDVLKKQTFIMPADMLENNCWKPLNTMIDFIKENDQRRQVTSLVTLYTSNVYAIMECPEQVLANMESIKPDVCCVTDFQVDRARHSIVAKRAAKYNPLKVVEREIKRLQAPIEHQVGSRGARGVK